MQDKELKVSVITAVWNGAQTIADAMESVRRQRLAFVDGAGHSVAFALEYLVVDGGSTDGTVEELRAFEKRLAAAPQPGFIFRWLSEPDHGLYDAINKGIRLSTGDVVGIVNADDIFAADDILARLAAPFLANPSLEAVYGDVRFAASATGVDALRRAPVVRYCTGRFFRRWMFRFATFPAHPSTFVRRDCFARFGDYSLQYRICADFELMLRFMYVHRIVMRYVPVCTHVMRLGGLSTDGLKSNLAINREDLAALRVHGVWSSMALIYCKYFFKVWGLLRKS